jgi:GT2 family glycosyltransferase
LSDEFAVVVVTHNSAREIAGLAGDLLRDVAEGDEIVFVDNGSDDESASLARELGERVRAIDVGANEGFAAGCRAGARATTAPLLLFLNPDIRIAPGALGRLRQVAAQRSEWAAWQPALLLADGRINSAGGVVHYLGIGWAGQCEGEAAGLASEPYEVSFPSGAALVIRRDVWQQLGGFEDSYFLYGEDLDLGLRLWLSGHRVGVEPRAELIHGYDFDKGARKWFLLERNRWRTLIACYPGPLLALLAPALLAAEVGLLLVAARDRWLRAKLRADLATLTGLRQALARRRAVQATRAISAGAFARILTSSLDSPYIGRLPRPLLRAQAGYFALVRLVLRGRSRPPVSIAPSARGPGPGGRES